MKHKSGRKSSFTFSSCIPKQVVRNFSPKEKSIDISEVGSLWVRFWFESVCHGIMSLHTWPQEVGAVLEGCGNLSKTCPKKIGHWELALGFTVQPSFPVSLYFLTADINKISHFTLLVPRFFAIWAASPYTVRQK